MNPLGPNAAGGFRTVAAAFNAWPNPLTGRIDQPIGHTLRAPPNLERDHPLRSYQGLRQLITGCNTV